LRPEESFKIICTPEQVEKMRKVVAHNGGRMETERTEADAVFIIVRKEASGGERTT